MQIATVFRVCFIAGIITFSSANFTQAQSSRQISYQGVVTQGDAKISDGWYSLTFALYGSVGSSVPLWQEEQRVYFQHGLFNVMLGAEFPLPERLPEDAWIGISFQGSGEFTRTKLTAVPYAMQAGIAEKAMYAEKAGELEGGVVSSINGIQGNVLMKASDGLEIRTDEEGGLIVGLSNEKRYEGILNQGTEWLLAGNTNANASSWLGTSNNFPLVIRTNNTERMRILSSNGNIGMGTTSPAERLHIVGNAQVDGNIVIKPTSSTSGELRIMENGGTQYTAFKSPQLSNNVIYTLPINDGNNGDVLTSDGSGVLSWQSVDGWGLSGNVVGAGKFIGTLNAQPLSFRTNNAERMSIGTTGNVAIGDETTSSKLTVAQSLFITNTGGTPEIKIEAPNNTTSTILKTTNQSANIVYTLPPDDGNNGQFLRTNGSGVLTWGDAGGGLTHFSETRNTAAPNAAGPAHRIQPFGNEANIDFVLSPRGIGAIMADIPDGTSTGGNKRGNNAVDWQMSRSSANQVASGSLSVIGGGYGNTASGSYSFVGGGFENSASGSYSFVGGGWDNRASVFFSFVGGGYSSTASGQYSFVGGGAHNTASGSHSFVGGGFINTASGDRSFVGGGRDNRASDAASFVGGGDANTASGSRSFIGGGDANTASGVLSFVGGGRDNRASDGASFVGGGERNSASSDGSFVGGGVGNTAASILCSVVGGAGNTASIDHSFVGGGADNTASANFSFVGGGLDNTASGLYSFVGGGWDNTAGGNLSFVGGGFRNTARGTNSSIPGGRGLTLDANADGSFGFHANNVDGTRNMTISAAYTAVFGNVDFWLANNDNSPRSLRFYEQYNGAGNFPNGANYVGFRAPNNVSTDITYTLPESAPTNNGQVLSSTTAGVLSWITPSGGGTVTMGGDLSGSADNAQIIAGAVGSNEISDNAILTSKIADGNVTLSKISQSGATNGQVLKWNGSAWSPSSDDNSGMTNFSETRNTGVPNTIVPVHQLSASGGEISIDIAISSKGDGAIMADMPDGTSTGGNKRGTNAVDWQMSRGNANQVASGASSVIMGGGSNRAGGSGATVGGGFLNNADGYNSTIDGGEQNTTSGDYTSISGGYNNTAGSWASVISGGSENIANGEFASISGGENNTVTGYYSSIIGGRGLTLDANANRSFGFHANNVDGTRNMTISAANTAVFGNVDFWLANNDNSPRSLRFYEQYNAEGNFPNGTNYVGFRAPNNVSAYITYTLPASAPTSNGQVLSSTTAGVMSWITPSGGGIVTMGGDLSGSADNAQIIAGAVGSNEIADNAILTSKIADGNVTLSKISQSGATIGQVLKWNDSGWSPSDDANTEYSAGTGISISSGIISSTGDTDASDDIVVSSTSGGDVSGTFSNLQIVANAVGSAEIADNAILTSKIADGNITLSKISQSGATNGQVLKWNGSAWSPSGDNSGMVNFSETRTVSAPNETRPVHQLSVVGSEANIDMALSPKGEGALTAHSPNNALSGGNKRGQYAVDFQTVRSAATQVASGSRSSIGGGEQNTASGGYSRVGGGYANIASGSNSAVSGGLWNTASSLDAVISGGRSNTASGTASTVAGGESNLASAEYSFVGGGVGNQATGARSSVLGGYNNRSQSSYSVVLGGTGMTLNGAASNSFGFLGANAGNNNNMTIAAANTGVLGNIDLWLANNDNTPRSLRFYEQYNNYGNFPNGTNYVGFRAPNNVSADITYTLPESAPTSNGQVLSSTTAGILSWITPGGGTVTMGGDLSGSSDNAQIVANAVGSDEISNHAVTTSKIADGNVTLSKISQSGATIGQVLKWNDSGWSPSDDANTEYGAGTGISISSGVISSTGDTDASDDIVVSSTSGGDVSGTFSNLQIVANAVGSNEISNNAIITSKIADGNITLSKISQSGATNGQVLKWNGSAWSPSSDANTEYSAGTGISISSGIISSTGDTDASDDIVVSSTAGGDVSGTFSNLQIVANAVGSNEISNNAIITSKIADGNITLSKISQSGATNGQVLKWNGSAWSPSGDNSGMVNFSETRTVSAPNETRPVHQLSVVGSEANIDMALSPKGEGALTAHSANNALSGGNKRGQYAVDFQTVRSAATQVASGSRSSIGGGEQNTASGGYSRVGGGYANIASGSNSVVSGGLWNTASSLDAVISGGRSNTASGTASTVAGGESNLASAEYSFVGGGVGNQATGARSSVLGGYNNRSQSSYSVVLGGTGMTLNGAASNSFGFLGANAGNNNMTIAAANTGVLGNVNLWLANNDGNAREIRFYEPNSATGTFPATGVFYTAFKAQAQDSSYTYTLPSSAPISNGQVLTASTGGTMSWATKSLKITVNNFDPDEVNAASFANFTVTANGVTTTDVISLHRVGGFGNLIVASAYVNTNNQVTIRVYNPTASPVNLGAENIIIGVIRE